MSHFKNTIYNTNRFTREPNSMIINYNCKLENSFLKKKKYFVNFLWFGILGSNYLKQVIFVVDLQSGQRL